jgi:dihydrofolate reductase
MKINVIVAVSDNGVIGKDGKIPWKLSTDLKRFKQITTGHPCIMGRKTWESLGVPLDERWNTVVSKSMVKSLSRPFEASHVLSAHSDSGTVVLYTSSLDVALEVFMSPPTPHAIFIIGGQQIYDEIFRTPDFIHRVYLTRVHCEVEGDTFFDFKATPLAHRGWVSEIRDSEWELIYGEFIPKGDKDEYDSTFQIWENVNGIENI